MKRIFTLLCFFSCIVFSIKTQASHIVGGDITYRHKGNDMYEVHLVLFIDCINGQPGAIELDRFANIGIFNASDFSFIDSFSIERIGPQRIDDVNYNCIEPPSNACVDMYTYTQDVTLPPIPGGYYLVFQRCCRNNTITNIISPDSTGATYFVTIPGDDKGFHNSSAVFNSLPPNFLCVNEKFNFDHSATDPDGDSLVYQIYTPFIGANAPFPRPTPPGGPPYTEVSWKNPFNLSVPLGTSSTFRIDTMSGLLTILPRQLGQFVIGVLVKEYRNGGLIGITRRDYQFNVLPCQLEVFAKFTAPELYCKTDISFTNQSKGEDFLWDFGVGGTTDDTSSAVNPTFIYPGDGNYEVTLIAKTGNCSDTFTRQVEIRDPSTYIFLQDDTAVCKGSTIELAKGQSAEYYSYVWTPGKWLDDSTKANPKATPLENVTYKVVKSYKGCSYTDSVKITVIAPKAKFSAPTLYCKTKVPFVNESTGDSFFWDFGVKGTKFDTSSMKNPVYNFPGDGDYKVVLTVKSGSCIDTFSQVVRVRDPAGYAFVKDDTSICLGKSINLGVSSASEGYTYEWLPDLWLDDNTSPNPKATPLESTTYTITKKYKECSFTDSIRIEVLNPVADFTYEIIPGCDSITVQFTNNSKNADSYEWYLFDKRIPAPASPVFKFPFGAKIKGSMTAKAKGKCGDSKKFEFELDNLEELGLIIPNVITPNNDNLNDCFEIFFKNINLSCLPRELHIFNRWGELVYEDENVCWNGNDRQNDKPLPDGTYYFIIEFAGQEFRGTVNIIR